MSERGIAIIGSTGSIGCNSLRVIESLEPSGFRVVALAAGHNVKILAEQIARHQPQLVSVESEAAAAELNRELSAREVKAPTILIGESGLVEVANKETLVMAGELMIRAAAKSGAELLPVDSEHNARHQCLRGEQRAEVRRIILTASGGPFRTRDKSTMSKATVAEAMQHPTWSMGAKITIDSATLMNKGLEVIE